MSSSVLRSDSLLPRIAMVSTHGYVAAVPPLGAADTGGQVVYVLELSKKLAQLGYEVDIWTRGFAGQPELEAVDERVRIIRMAAGGNKFIEMSILSDAMYDCALRYLTTGTKVKVTYSESFFRNSLVRDTNYSIVSLAPLKGLD